MKTLVQPSFSSSLPRDQRGVTLLEVLVSVLVLSVGLLGYAGLQMISLKNNNSAYQRSQATLLTNDIMDRMRANRPNLASYTVAMGSTGTYPDVASWKLDVETALPDGDASIQVDMSGNATITIQWDDNRDGTDPIQFVTETAL
jgi:type IV pilus assembly protein PilV